MVHGLTAQQNCSFWISTLIFLGLVFLGSIVYPAQTANAKSKYSYHNNRALVLVEEEPIYNGLTRAELFLGPYYQDGSRSVVQEPDGMPEVTEPDGSEPDVTDVTSQEGTSIVPLCRFGVNVNSDNGPDISTYEIDELRLGWYINYLATPTPSRPNGMEYAPVVRLAQTGPDSYAYSPGPNQLLQAIANNPGADWLIGNEPDRQQFQDGIEPHLYARAYHELYGLIKEADPNAKVFAGTIVQPTQLRLRYLKLILTNYRETFGEPMPVDGWAIHNFLLNEASCEHYQDLNVCWGADIPPGIDALDGLNISVEDNDNMDLFALQIQLFRQWMFEEGYQNAALYVSEYGVLMPATFGFNSARVNIFMDQSFDYMLHARDFLTGNPNDDYRLVQRLSWYSISDIQRFNGYLFRPSAVDPSGYQRSQMGDNFVEYVSEINAYTDIYPAEFTVNPPSSLQQSGRITATLEAVIANSGNRLTADSAIVRFYQGDPSNGGVQMGTDQTVSLTGCGDQATAQMVWPNVVPDQYSFYVEVEPANSSEDLDLSNNRSQTRLLFITDQVFLPLIYR